MARKLGFTLAEVLITLGIIGVVAAMTIPTLMNQTGQAEFRTGFKKAVSVLNQAITMNVALDGNDFSALIDGKTANSATIYNMFTSRMNVVATTSPGTATMGASFTDVANNYTLFFNDGMAISFPKTAGQTLCTTQTTTNCKLVVDVNGTKRPNRLSLSNSTHPNDGVFDQFVLDFYNQQVSPHDEEAKYVLYN